MYRGAALQPSEYLNELWCSIVVGNSRTICLTYLLYKVICCSTQIAERTERKVQCHIRDILRRIWHCTFAQNDEISWCRPALFVVLKETSLTPTRSLNYNSTSWWLFVRTNPANGTFSNKSNATCSSTYCCNSFVKIYQLFDGRLQKKQSGRQFVTNRALLRYALSTG